MERSAVRTRRLTTRTWRMRAWPGDASVAHLIFLDHLHVPNDDELAEAIDHALRKGARAVRTSAMFPNVTDVVLDAGFSPIDRLALLRLDLAEWSDRSYASTPEPHDDARHDDRRDEGHDDSSDDGHDDRQHDGHDLGPLRPWMRQRCAAIDRAAFGLRWGNTPASLREITVATPHARGRVARVGRRIEAFAITGAAAEQGYLQRLAVAPEMRRRGLAAALVTDSLAWMKARRLDAALVNTGVDNDAALTLYTALGFRRLDDELTIAERTIES